ncbi:translesion error-prone DNA polymerase V autoproteolytic subunit [Massilia sp. W12]|uniref:LexA family protein n=1 Tax=Massilia sp. W12 TaxID=3126507 RepID=UPI0030D1A191
MSDLLSARPASAATLQQDAQTLRDFPCELPMPAHRIRAGFPSPAQDESCGELDLNSFLVRNPAASFVFEVRGDSMQGAGILEGDRIIVDRSRQAQQGDIVVAAVEGEFTVKRLFMRRNQLELHPENPAYPVLKLDADSDCLVWGVVVGVVRRVGGRSVL